MAPGASFLEIWKRLETLTPERCRAGGSPERKGYSIWLSFGTILGPRLLQIASLFDVIFNVLFVSVFRQVWKPFVCQFEGVWEVVLGASSNLSKKLGPHESAVNSD